MNSISNNYFLQNLKTIFKFMFNHIFEKYLYSTNDVPINPNGSCGGGWVCEHRWNAIQKMV